MKKYYKEFILVLIIFVLFSVFLFVSYLEHYTKSENKRINHIEEEKECINNCKPYRVMFCNSEYVICDGLNAANVIILK